MRLSNYLVIIFSLMIFHLGFHKISLAEEKTKLVSQLDDSFRADLFTLKQSPKLFQIKIIPVKGKIQFSFTDVNLAQFDLSKMKLEASLFDIHTQQVKKNIRILQENNNYFILDLPKKDQEIRIDAISGESKDSFIIHRPR